MSYIVLARKWRPQNFDDLIGQETVVKTLKNALASGKIVHAYLFSGPRGVGKTSAARILAKSLNCLEGPASEPCGKCRHCQAITEGSSVDVFEIDGASNTGVDDVRELRESVKYAPSSGKYKIYIIDEVHMLSTQAFNALLKTLEEPPAHVIFIFATTEPKKIPPTIQSRCQHHSFRRISKERIKEQLLKIVNAEKINIEEAALEMIARAADGSIRDALTLLDQASSFSDNITAKDLQTLLGLPEVEIMSNLAETILTGDISSTLSTIKELTDRGSDLRSISKELVEHFRNLAIVKITPDAKDILDYSIDDIQRFKRQVSEVSIEELTLLLTELLRLEGEVRSAINPRYTLELGLLRTSFIKGMTSLDEILKMLGNSVEHSDISKPALTQKKESESPSYNQKEEGKPQETPDKSSAMDKEKIWHGLIRNLDSKEHLLACKLAEAKIINLTASEFIIGFNGGMSVLADSIRNNSQLIERELNNLTGNKLRLKVMSLAAEETKNNTNDLKKKILSEPLVQDAMRLFNSAIVEVRSLKDKKSE
ncbi:MAG: DNA polymerase III subunit gamma/tau [Nitrospirae bacterium]|nr:DNA polymerase III subunit gamma/tau [Nitrospirota bacterium]